MKKITLLFIALILSFAFINPQKSYNQVKTVYYLSDGDHNGKDLTEKKACTLCHQPEKKVVGPSFKEIAVKYNGDATKILQFLEGKSNPIVEPDEFQYMQPVIKQLKHSAKEEKEAIAKYIASLK